MNSSPLKPLRFHAPLGATLMSAIAVAISSAMLGLMLALSILSSSPADYFAVESDSMKPVFARGDLVLVKPTSALNIGDVVTFRKYGTLVTHRIVAEGKQPGSFETRGDNNTAGDPWTITDADVVGRSTDVIHNAGWPLLFFNDPIGRAGLSALFMALLAALTWGVPKATKIPPILLHPASGFAVS